jgi:hypothetical protein
MSADQPKRQSPILDIESCAEFNLDVSVATLPRATLPLHIANNSFLDKAANKFSKLFIDILNPSVKPISIIRSMRASDSL